MAEWSAGFFAGVVVTIVAAVLMYLHGNTEDS